MRKINPKNILGLRNLDSKITTRDSQNKKGQKTEKIKTGITHLFLISPVNQNSTPTLDFEKVKFSIIGHLGLLTLMFGPFSLF